MSKVNMTHFIGNLKTLLITKFSKISFTTFYNVNRNQYIPQSNTNNNLREKASQIHKIYFHIKSKLITTFTPSTAILAIFTKKMHICIKEWTVHIDKSSFTETSHIVHMNIGHDGDNYSCLARVAAFIMQKKKDADSNYCYYQKTDRSL